MPVDTSIQIRKLPFRVISKLDLYLEPPSNRNWEALIRAMPDERFSQHEVELLRLQGSRQGNTCTKLLLQDLGQRCVTVKELGFYLKRVGNYDAMMALDWPNEPVVIKTQPEGKVLSEGEEVRLRTEADGFPPPRYQWYKNDEDIIIGEVTCELRLSNVTTSASGEYYCIALNDNDSVKTNQVKVKVMRKGPTPSEPAEPLPDAKPVITTHPLPGCILPGHYHQLHCKAIGKLPLAYLWYMNGQPLLNSNFPTLEIRSFLEQDEGSYACKVSNAYGDDISNVVDLTIDQKARLRTVATDKVALLIGNQDYTEHFPQEFQGQGNLRHTIEDTQTLGSLLHREDMGFNVLSFANLSRDEMEKAVYEYLHLLSEGCYAVFYFAGHGFEINGKHYLVPVDAPAEWTPQDAVCIQWILEAIWKSRPKLTVILLDMCRVRPVNDGKAHFEDYVFPHDLKIVIGFATCSQSESYERVEEENGIYMKHLKKHICRDVKIEDILHDVTTDVDKEARECMFTERQRPEYHSKGGGYFSLRDPVIPHGNTSAERWLKAHKLPERRIIEFEAGVKVELRFEHCNWLTNTINILVGVIDKGMADHCYAYIYQLPNSLEGHFPKKKQIPLARSWPHQAQAPQPIPATERSTEMFHLQRLCGNITVTIALESGSPGGKTTKYKVEVFTAKEFGLAQVFQT